jgi:hypothetical protein
MPAKVTDDYDKMMIRMMYCEQNVGLIGFHLLLLRGDMKGGRALAEQALESAPPNAKRQIAQLSFAGRMSVQMRKENKSKDTEIEVNN